MEKDLANLNLPTLKTVDQAVFNYVKNLSITSFTNKGQKNVPVIWMGAERSFQIKRQQELRDNNGVLILPQIVVARTGMSKSLTWKGTYYGVIPEVNDKKGGVVNISRRLTETKNSEFQRANSINKTKGNINFKSSPKENKIVFEHLSIPIPIYLDMTYQITVRTEYQNQMNEILSPFFDSTGGSKYITAESEGWKFECFFEEGIGLDNNIGNFDESERIFKTQLDLKALGYIIGSGNNQEKPKKVIRENAVKISLEERVVDDINEE